MPLQVSLRIPTGEVSRIRERLHQSVASARSHLVQSATQMTLTEIIDSVPIETGETKREWESERSRLAAAPPSSPSAHQSLQSATNYAEQMVYIEYGTAHLRPRHIVSSAFARLRTRLSSLFRWAD